MIHFPSRAARDRYELSLRREETTRLSLETAAKLRAKLRNTKASSTIGMTLATSACGRPRSRC
jgi:hypothetical protein